MPDLLSVTLYGKPDCHLCDEAEERLVGLARQLRRTRQRQFTYQKVDIQSAPDLFERYRDRIPVIEVSGGATLDWPVSAERLRQAVLAATRP